ncbi:immunoglobulin-like domain-containing protein, partial [Paenibacillus sp. Soil787]|uniref:immunoglobulin-like domain-containing protein n=1 Tax=Paenibacillus sp. Soil787 TaxID=1736411 RepID=UPI0039E1A4FF
MIATVKAGSISDPVPLSGLSIQPLSGDFFINQSTPLTLVKTPSNTTEQSFNWVSSNVNIVKVDNQGVITGMASGTATITVSSVLNPSITASIDITVKAPLSPVLINPSIVNIDFNQYNLQVANTGVITLDSSFLGTITPTKDASGAPQNSAGLVSDGTSDVFYLEAVTSGIGSYKAGINNTNRIALQTRLKFNNTDSTRSIFEMKSTSTTPPTGSPAWSSLLSFDNAGKIKDFKGNVLGNYAVNQWYDIVIDLDTPNHRYRVWIDGVLRVNNLDLGNWIGIYQNKITQNTNASKTPSRTLIANLKVGDIVPPLQDLIVPDMTMDKGKAAILTYQTVPNPAYVEKITWTSSNPGVAKVIGNGLLALNTGTATITATESYSGISKSFQVTVQEPVHQWNAHSISADDLKSVLWVGYRPEVDYSFDQIMTTWPELQTYLNMDESTFIQTVSQDSAKLIFPNTRSKFEKYARLYAQLYKLTNDPKYARRSALILYYQALDYPRIVLNHNYSDFYSGNNVFPQDTVYAYGALFDSDIWGQLDPSLSAAEVKQTIQEFWIRPGAYETYREMNSMRLDNITPYGTRSGAVTALLLNDPDMIHQAVNFLDRLWDGSSHLSDGMWYEETSHYGDQVANNTVTTINVIKDWTDPADYQDTAFGIHLNQSDLTPRWPLLQQSLGFATNQLIYPDGTAVPINDSDPKLGSPQPLPLVSKGLKNIELPGLGYYGLFQGDTTEATRAGLLFQHTNRGFAGGHTHTNWLSLDLWGGGVELLPYTGYVHTGGYPDGSGANLRFPSFRPHWMSMPWVWRQDGANEVASDDWTEPALLAYDSGDANGKKVQLVEGSDPGVAGKGATMNRRMMMMVNLDGNRNYTFDLTRMQGGQAHEIYQRGSELEDMNVQMNGIQLTDTGKPDLKTYLTSINSTQGLSVDRDLLKNPQAGVGINNSFDFTWTGQQTRAAVHTFMNGVNGSDVFLTKMPTARRINTKADEANYLTPNLIRRHIVSDTNQITQFGAVHEAIGNGEMDLVGSVDWVTPDDKDPMTSIAVVHSGKYNDIIYASNDTKERSYNGITFAGSAALARIDATTGKLLFTYVNGQGKVAEQAHILIGNDTQQLDIIAATTSSLNTALDPDGRKNTITVKGKFSNPEALKGQRILTRFGDGSGYGLKVEDVTELADSTVLTVETFNPFRVTDQGVETIFFPVVSIPGKAYVVFNLPKFKNVDSTAPTIMVSGSNSLTAYLGSTYTDAGATATDNVDGDVTSSIVTTGTVDTSKEGIYSITYGVQDHAGNTAIATRTVQVINVYKFSGILQPINLDGSSVFKQGSTVPVKFQLTDALNQYVSNLSASIKVTYLSGMIFLLRTVLQRMC